MRWERVAVQGGGGGPGKRWGHTCNAVRGGKLLYVFGGFGDDNRHTNKVHVFDTVNKMWSEPLTNGASPSPRDSHSCTTIGNKLFVFGGTNGRESLNDLHILDTSSNTWISPSLSGDSPNPREGHSAALIGKQLFIFGGCGNFGEAEIFYDDVYVLNTETLVWKRIVPSGIPPSKRESHSCSSWNSKIIIIGGQDTSNFYQSDVHILDTDTLAWCKLNTTGQILPPRAGHTTISLGKNLFVFGGFTDNQSLFDDVYMLDLAAGTWSEVMPTGEGPSARFSVAGDCLNPHLRGVLVFIGGCDKNLQPLEDMYYLHTGRVIEAERDERRIEKLSFRKQLKLKCQEQQALASPYDNTLVGFVGSSVSGLSGLYTGAMKAAGASRQVFQLLDCTSSMPKSGNLCPLGDQASEVELEDIWLAYPSRPSHMVVKGITLKLQTGSKVALVGPSGGGKYQTHVGEQGLRLSGGQKQRIAIARALLILLDEATGALDAESEYLVQDAMDSLMKGRTVLVIAHRSANTVAVVSDGQIVESGTHDDLLNKNGIYKALVKRQFSSWFKAL